MQTKTGKVISDKGDKTIIVEVVRYVAHPKYIKKYPVTSKFMAHDEKNEFKIGDEVTIYETRPLSKRKRWTTEAPQKQKDNK